MGVEFGKNSFPKTSAVTVPYSRKSYHSIVVPTVLAMTARRNCARCSSGDKPVRLWLLFVVIPSLRTFSWILSWVGNHPPRSARRSTSGRRLKNARKSF